MALGKQIKHYREKAGWQLKELSARADVDIGTISALEIRDSERSKFFQPIAAAFGLTVDQMADGSTDHPINLEALAIPPSTPLEPRGPSVFAKTLADAFDCLPDDLEVRSLVFTEVMKLLKRALVTPPCAPPVLGPQPVATAQTPP